MDGTLLGALVGASSALLGAFGVEMFREHREGRRRALATRAELTALIQVIEHRGLEDALRKCRDECLSGNVVQMSMHLGYDPVPATRRLLENPGAVPSAIIGLVAKVVVFVDSLKADINRLAAYPVDHEQGLLRSARPDDSARVYEEARQLTRPLGHNY